MKAEPPSRFPVALTLSLLCYGLALGCGGGAGSKKKDRMNHKGGLPVPPGAQVVLDHTKGERYILEFELRSPLLRVVDFYRRQLAKEGWTGLRVWQLEGNFWAIRASKGMFTITGRIIPKPGGRVSVGIERDVTRRRRPGAPPMPRGKPQSMS